MDELEIVVGTYENLILGYRIEKNADDGLTLESSFTTDSHRGALRCLAVSWNGTLASSSTDDSIRLHSLKKRREIGSLFQHDGSVNRIRFFKGGNMFSASEDGTICLWRCKNWEMLRVFKGHRGHVKSVAVHPSGKLGLSVGSDRMFFTWDMTTGKLAFKRKLEEVAQDILFSYDGSQYILIFDRHLEICALEDTTVLHTVKLNSRINDACFVQENLLAVACDNGELTVIDTTSNTQILQTQVKGRIKSMSLIPMLQSNLLCIATSTGSLLILELDLTEGEESSKVLLAFESGVRITCMTAYAPVHLLKHVEAGPDLVVKNRKIRRRERRDLALNNKEADGEDTEHGEGKQGEQEADSNDEEEDEGEEEEKDDDSEDEGDDEDSEVEEDEGENEHEEDSEDELENEEDDSEEENGDDSEEEEEESEEEEEEKVVPVRKPKANKSKVKLKPPQTQKKLIEQEEPAKKRRKRQ